MLRRASKRSLEAALRDLGAERPTTRASAAEDIARYAETHLDEVIDALGNALSDVNGDVRAAAASALGDVASPKAFDALAKASEDGHTFVRQMALSALGELRDERAVVVFENALQSTTPSDRFQAVLGFARCSRNADRIRRVLLDATRDDDHLVRHIALRMAEERGDDEGVVESVFVERTKALLDDESDVVRVAAAVILGRMGRRDGADILADVASREVVTSEHDDEAAAIELCGELGLTKANAALIKRAFGRVILLTRDPFVWHARVALAALGHDKAVKWVLDELKAWTRERRTLGVAAAGRARLAKARPLIEAMAGDAERADPDAVAEALSLLESS